MTNKIEQIMVGPVAELHSPTNHSRLGTWLPAQPHGVRMTSKQYYTWGGIVIGIACLAAFAVWVFYPEAVTPPSATVPAE